MIKKFTYVIALLFLAPKISYSEETIKWEDCVRQAKESNPELKSAVEQVKQAKKDIDINLSVILPQVDSEITGVRSETGNNKPSNTYSYDISARQLVFDGFKTASEISNAVKNLESTRYNYDLISSNIRLNLRAAFVALMRSEELVIITESIAERRKQNLELVKLKYEGGRENRGSLLAAEADMAQATFDIEKARRSVVLAQRELSKEIGLSYLAPVKATPEFYLEKNYDAKPNLEYIADTTPFLLELISKKDAARYNLNSKEADFLPKVYLSGGLGRSDDSWPPKESGWSAGFSVSLPLFEGGRRIAETSKARSQFKQAKEDERSGRDGVLVTLERTWKDLMDTTTNVSVQKKFLEAAEERAKITRSEYAIGLATFNDWIIIEDNLVKAQNGYLNTQADMLISEAYWIQAIGGTLDYE